MKGKPRAKQRAEQGIMDPMKEQCEMKREVYV